MSDVLSTAGASMTTQQRVAVGTTTIVAAGSNTKGILVLLATLDCSDASYLNSAILSDGVVEMLSSFGSKRNQQLQRPMFIPPGRALQWSSQNATPADLWVVYRVIA